MKHLILFRLLLSLICFSRAQDAVIDIRPDETRLPLGISEFQPVPGEFKKLPQEPARIIAEDLEFSGRVKIIETLRIDSAALRYFMMNEAYAYISGAYAFQGDDILLKCFLNDSETGELIFEKKFITRPNQLRRVAHKFSDELTYQLFGEKGIAQTRIVFVSKTSGVKQAYIIDYDGANPVNVTNNESMTLFPCWLRGNAAIMYTSYLSGAPQLYIKDLPDGKEIIFQKSRFLNTSPDFNPIDGEIVYTSSVKGNTEIFRASESGENPVRLTFSRALESSPSWSPNGYEIVFTSSRSGNPNLYIMDRDGSNIRRLTYEGKYNTSASWSPKGDKIAFCGMNERGQMDIFVISPAGTGLKRLTFDSGSNESPSWSPDGRAIVFASSRLGKHELFSMREDGSNQKQITIFGQNTSPNWSDFYN